MHKVLVVEDSEESKNLICQALGSDFEITWAQSIADTNKSLSEGSYDIVLLDVGLPDGDGFHFFFDAPTRRILEYFSHIFNSKR